MNSLGVYGVVILMSREMFLRKQYEKLTRLGIVLGGVNTLRFQGSEEFNHALAKFLVCFGILRDGHRFKTEQKINSSICDIIDLDNFIIYEIESNADSAKHKSKLEDFYHPHIEDIVIIDLKKLSGWEAVGNLFDSVCSRYGILTERRARLVRM